MTFKDIQRNRGKKLIQTNVVNKHSVFDVLLSPVYTEKTYKLSTEDNKYTFKVHGEANKNDVKVAIKELYNVTPVGVSILNTLPKARSHRKLVKRSYKKAIVTLGKDEKIEFTA